MAENTGGARNIDISGFFQGLMATSLAADECLTEVRFPVWNGPAAIGTGFREVSIRAGDFAIVAAAVQLALDESGVCKRAAVALGGVAPTPLKIEATAEALLSTKLDAETVGEAARLAARSVGKTIPAGALTRKSSPGNGGPPSAPLNGSATSTASKAVKRPVVTGVPPMTAQPSYTQPAGNVGRLSPTAGAPVSNERNQMPLFSLVSAEQPEQRQATFQ